MTDQEIIRHRAILDQRVAYVRDNAEAIIDESPERLDALMEAANTAPDLVSRQAAGMDAVHGCCGVED